MSTHIEVLRSIAECYGQPRYLEIGVGDSGCFQQIAPHCSFAVGVDVPENPYGSKPGEDIHALDNAVYYGHGSDAFFVAYGFSEEGLLYEPFDLIFIDGSHWEEQVRRDFKSASECISPLGTIALHDTWSPDAQTASEGSDTAYRVALGLECSPDWQAYTLPVRPGLTLCRRDVPRSY